PSKYASDLAFADGGIVASHAFVATSGSKCGDGCAAGGTTSCSANRLIGARQSSRRPSRAIRIFMRGTTLTVPRGFSPTEMQTFAALLFAAYVFVPHNANMMSSNVDLDRALAVRHRLGSHFLWVREKGVEYVIRDDAALDRI